MKKIFVSQNLAEVEPLKECLDQAGSPVQLRINTQQPWLVECPLPRCFLSFGSSEMKIMIRRRSCCVCRRWSVKQGSLPGSVQGAGKGTRANLHPAGSVERRRARIQKTHHRFSPEFGEALSKSSSISGVVIGVVFGVIITMGGLACGTISLLMCGLQIAMRTGKLMWSILAPGVCFGVPSMMITLMDILRLCIPSIARV